MNIGIVEKPTNAKPARRQRGNFPPIKRNPPQNRSPRVDKISYKAVRKQEKTRHVSEINRVHENACHGGNKQKRVLAYEQLIGAHEHERKQYGEIDEIRVTQNPPEQHISAEHVAERAHERRPLPLPRLKQ